MQWINGVQVQHQRTLINIKTIEPNKSKVIKENKRKSWHEYVLKLNTMIPAKKVWEMSGRKISGKQSNTTINHLGNNGGTKIIESVLIHI